MIPNWLVPWWNWWADFTDLFDWSAIGAIASAAAVMWALLSTLRAQRASAREAQLRSINLMKALLIVCGNGIHVVHMTLSEGKDRGESEAQTAAKTLSVDSFNEVQRTLAAFSVQDLHSTTAIDILMSARTGMQNLRQSLQVTADGFENADMVYQHLAYWENLLLGISNEILRLGGSADQSDNQVVRFWIKKVASLSRPQATSPSENRSG